MGLHQRFTQLCYTLCVMAGPVHIACNELGRLVSTADHMRDDNIV